jgi:hypothetical protein
VEDNEDTELTIEKIYNNDLIPLQGELLNTKTTKQDYRAYCHTDSKTKQNLINIPKLYLQSPKILKQSDSLSYEP